MKNRNLSSRAARGAGVVGVSAIAIASGLAVAAAPASASAYDTGWECLSPFVNYTNGTYPEDPPAPDAKIDSLNVDVERPGGEALVAKPGEQLPLRDLEVTFDYKDQRPIAALWTRTATLSTTWSGAVPIGATDEVNRSLTVRSPGTGVVVTGPASVPGVGDKPIAKVAGVAGERWWSFTVNLTPVEQALPKINNWYSDGVPNATTGNVTRTYWVEKKNGNAAPRTKDLGSYATASSSVGHKYVTHTGDNRFPVNASVVIEATNTLEGTQTLHAEGSWVVNVKDPTPGSLNDPIGYADGDHTVNAPAVNLRLPRSNWTPTGTGPVEFRIAGAEQAEGVVSRSTGYDRAGYNRPLAIKPFGSVFVRFETESYGSSHDCVPGDISVVNPAIAWSPNSAPAFFGNSDPNATAEAPDTSVGDLENPGFVKNNAGTAWNPAKGAKGRFGFDVPTQPAIATAPLYVAPAPVVPAKPEPTPAEVAAAAQAAADKAAAVAAATAPIAKAFSVAQTTVKAASSTLKVNVTNPNSRSAGFTLRATTPKAVKVGRTRKIWTLATGAKTVVDAGASKDVSLKLSSAAKTLLKTQKSIKAKLTITATDRKRASTVVRTITIKR